jgi:transposase
VREPGNLPPAERCICSPYDLNARYARHNAQVWVGYRTHLTESCDADAQMHVITQVETVLAPTQDVEVVTTIHADLAAQGLKPQQHYVDAAYLSAELLVSTAQQEAIELIGPVTKLQNVSWQAKEQTGYDTAQFQIDWDAKQATCPQGQTSVKWYDNVPDRHGNAAIQINFAAAACQACTARPACTHRAKGGRTIRVRPQVQYEALRHARSEQTTEALAQKYRPRLGIEGTISQAVRAFELRATRYCSLAKTHVQSVALAAAINVCRFADYLAAPGLSRPEHPRSRLWQPDDFANRRSPCVAGQLGMKMAILAPPGWHGGRMIPSAESLTNRRTWMPLRHNKLWYPVRAGKHVDQNLLIGASRQPEFDKRGAHGRHLHALCRSGCSQEDRGRLLYDSGTAGR